MTIPPSITSLVKQAHKSVENASTAPIKAERKEALVVILKSSALHILSGFNSVFHLLMVGIWCC